MVDTPGKQANKIEPASKPWREREWDGKGVRELAQ